MTGRSVRSLRQGSACALALVAVAGLTMVQCDGGWSPTWRVPPTQPNDVVGSGVVALQSRAVSGFDVLSLVGIGTVYLEQGGSESLTVQAEDNLLQYLQTEVVGGVLEISTAPGVDLEATRPIEFFVTATQLRRASLSGVGEIECTELTANRLRLESSGVGDLRFENLDLRRLDVFTSGVATVRVTGEVEIQVVSLSGTGEYKARRLRSAEADVRIEASGSATVRVRDRLVATISGSGCVYYVGDPTVEATITGSGCVEKIG